MQKNDAKIFCLIKPTYTASIYHKGSKSKLKNEQKMVKTTPLNQQKNEIYKWTRADFVCHEIATG